VPSADVLDSFDYRGARHPSRAESALDQVVGGSRFFNDRDFRPKAAVTSPPY
jgi:hypothetical protein